RPKERAAIILQSALFTNTSPVLYEGMIAGAPYPLPVCQMSEIAPAILPVQVSCQNRIFPLLFFRLLRSPEKRDRSPAGILPGSCRPRPRVLRAACADQEPPDFGRSFAAARRIDTPNRSRFAERG